MCELIALNEYALRICCLYKFFLQDDKFQSKPFETQSTYQFTNYLNHIKMHGNNGK
jgi:hypothetical protein